MILKKVDFSVENGRFLLYIIGYMNLTAVPVFASNAGCTAELDA